MSQIVTVASSSSEVLSSNRPGTLDLATNEAGATSAALRDLRAGQIVVLPTESDYQATASALDPVAVRALVALGDGDTPPALVLGEPAEALDWLPFLRGPGVRLLRRFGPGPWQLQARPGLEFGLFARLPEAVRGMLAPDGLVTLYCPDHPVWAKLVQALRGPLVSVSLRPPQVSAAEAEKITGPALVLDGGPGYFGRPPTLVRVDGKQVTIRRAGGLAAEDIDEAISCRVVFVCTGNTCRSPMAEALCKKLLAEALRCGVAELPGRGFLVQSAGLAAMMGEGASPEAVEIVKEQGGDLSTHRSRPLTLDLFTQADHVIAMTRSHLHALLGANLDDAPVPRLLSPAGRDVSDPIGSERAVYQACADEIMGHLRRRLPELLQDI